MQRFFARLVVFAFTTLACAQQPAPVIAASRLRRVLTLPALLLCLAVCSVPALAQTTITGFSPASGPVGTSVTITGTNLQGTTVVGFNGHHPTSFTVNGAGTQITTTVPTGATTGKIAVIAPGGEAFSSTDFTVVGPPTITSFTPTSGAVGASVTITGTNLQGTTVVGFNGHHPTSFTVSPDGTQITTTVPSGATTGPIAVITPVGEAFSSTNFTVIGPPTIIGFSPASGPVGASVTITGTNLQGTTVVGFNGHHPTSFTVTPDGTQITTTVPSGATTGPIAVIAPGGEAVSGTSFTVTTSGTPTISAFSPASGLVGTSVTITGTNFTGATAVTFNGTAATAFTVVSATSITATVPAGASSGPIAVTTPSGTVATTSAFTVYLQIDCGSMSGFVSNGVVTWGPDNGSPMLTTGRTLTTMVSTFASLPAGVPYQLFQSQRVSDGAGFTYTETGIANGSYTLSLYFAEIDPAVTGVGQRLFNVSLNGAPVLTNFDIYKTAGASFKVVTESFPVTVTNNQFIIAYQDGTGGTVTNKSLAAAFALSPPIQPAADIPPPGWGDDAVPADSGTGADGDGPAASLGVSLPSLMEENHPGPDLSVYNPLGPGVSYERMYRGNLAASKYASPGLSPGWTDAYDLYITPVLSGMTVTGYNLHYPNGAVDAWTGASGTLATPNGSPYIVAAAGATITMEFRDRSVTTFTQKSAASAHNYPANTYLLTKIANIVGHFVTFNRSVNASDDYHVTSLVNDGGTTLLTINYDGNDRLASVQDLASQAASHMENRQVDYAFDASGQLTDVTHEVGYGIGFGMASDQWHYGYQTTGLPLLNSVQTPDPASPGTLGPAATVTYDPSGHVAAHTDANSSQRKYLPTPGGGQIQVSVYNQKTDPAAIQQWTQMNLTGTGGMNADAGMKDATGYSTSMAYTSPGGSYVGSPSPYLPSVGIDRNRHPVALTYDTSNTFGNVLTMTDNRGTRTALTYDPAFPLGQVKTSQELQVTGGATGTVINVQKTPTTFKYFTTGVMAGLLSETDTPLPGSVDSGATVATTYTYTGTTGSSLGDIATIVAPGVAYSGNASYSTLTTTFGYTSDGTYSAPESVGEPLTVMDAAGDITHYRYDGRGNCTAVIDASGYETDSAYTVANQVQAVFYPSTSSKTGAYVYTAYQYPGGPVTSVALYPEGTAYPPMGATPDRMTTYTYDHEGQVLTVTDLVGAVATYTYDGLGRVTSVTDAGTGTINGTSHTTKYIYNSDGSLSQTQYPHAAGTASGSFDTETYTYDPDQNVMTTVDGRGVTTTYARNDAESLVTGVSYTLPMSHPGVAAISPVTYGYDGYGRRMTMADGTGDTSYAYDDLDLPLSVTTDFNLPGTSMASGPQGQTLTYGYNPDGSRYSMTTPLDNQVGAAGNRTLGTQWYRDQARRVTEVLFPWAGDGGVNYQFGTAAYGYYPNGWLRKTQLAQFDPTQDDLVDTTPMYDARGFLTDLSTTYSPLFLNTGTAGSLVNDFGSTGSTAYDSSGNRQALLANVPAENSYLDTTTSPHTARNQIPDASRSLSYTYDPRDELTLDKGALALGDTTDNYKNVHNFPFAYDKAFNPTTFRGTGTNAFTNDEQLATFDSMTGASFGTFTFDGAGSPTTYQSKALVFDPEDRLVSALGATFTYDGDGKRVTKTVGGVTTYYLYDGDELVDEETNADPNNPVIAAYGWGVDGIRARYSFPGSSAADLPADSSLAYLYDPSGNVSERLELLYNNDPAQTDGLYVQVRDYQVFDAYGALSGRIDTVSYPSVPMDLDPVGFGGQEGYYTDLETGLCLLGARYYDPSTGRFLNRDPIGYDGGINLYGFAGNNPVNESDPSGDGPAASPGSGSHHFGPKNTGKGINLKFSISEEQIECILLGLVEGIEQTQVEEGTINSNDEEVEDVAVSSTSLNLASGSNTNCFVSGTLVQMADGTVKKIEDVRAGDWVLSRNPDTGATEAKAVMSRSVKAAPQVLTLTLVDSATRLTQTITCTPGHPFYVQGQGFVLAGSLGIGTSIVTRAGPCLSVASIAYEPKSAGGVLVYNFTVQDDHTYFVGTLDGGTWVHNNSPATPIKVVSGGQGEDLAQAATEHRELLDLTVDQRQPGNLSVFEYEHMAANGTTSLRKKIFYSNRYGHAEANGLAWFEKRGMLGSVKRVYSERHPCMDEGSECLRVLKEKVPQAEVYYSYPHRGLGR